jgi:hypothetical protein
MIGINIWDDFYDDGHIPEGEIQETYIYVEEHGLSQEDKKLILQHVIWYIEFDALLDNKTQMELAYFNTEVKYPNLSADNYHLHFTRWEIRLKNITHQQVENLVEELNKAELKYKEEQFEFYSES